jgi:excisionase family DNA binding protein
MAPRDYETDPLMTVAEIAAILKLNPQTVRNWIDAGTLPHLRIGERRVRVWRSDFQAFIHAGESSAPPAPTNPTIWEP